MEHNQGEKLRLEHVIHMQMQRKENCGENEAHIFHYFLYMYMNW